MEKRNFKKLSPRFGKPRNEDHLIVGPRAIFEAIRADREIDKILLNRELKNDQIKDLLEEAKAKNIPFQKVPNEKLVSLTAQNHQGMVAFVARIHYADFETLINEAAEQGKAMTILVLDGITDVRNFGAISRSAEALGADLLVVPNRNSAQINSEAMKTSAGALNHIPVCRVEYLPDAVLYLKASGVKVFACTEKAQTPIFKANFKKSFALVMGSEETGISKEVLKICDEQILIPLVGKVESLNVSTAATTVLYEAIRQRQSK